MSTPPNAPTDPRPGSPAGHALPAGTRLEYFEIGRVVSTSSFCIVYAATDLTLQQAIAIKEYFPASIATRGEQLQVVPRSAQQLEVFQRGQHAFVDEARRLARCNHPCLLRIHRLWEANGTVYRAMPFYEGSSLLTWRQTLKQPPSEDWLRALVNVLLDALETLQKAGLVHRRITPPNVMMQPDGQPVLMDFDAVRSALVSSQSQSLMAALDPAFSTGAAADSVPGTETGLGPDLHALAALLHFCISGHWPLSAQFDMQWREPLDEVVQRLRIASPGLRYHPAFVRAIDTLLAQPPQGRTASIDEFRSMFDAPPELPEAPRAAAAPEAASAPAQTPAMPEPAADAAPRAAGTAAPNPSVSVLNLLASFDQRGAAAPAPAEPPAGTVPPLLTDRVAASVPPQPAPQPAPPAAPAAAPAFGESTFGYPARDPGPSMFRDSMMVDVPWTERAAHASRMSARSVRPSWRRRLGVVGVVVLLLGVAVGAAWQLNEMHETDSALSRISDANAVGGTGDLTAGNPSATGTVLPAPLPAEATSATPAPAAPQRPSPGLGMQDPSAQRNNAAIPAPASPVTAGASVPSAGTPREACGARTEFALYRCMQNQCTQTQWRKHPQCNSFRMNEGLPE